MAKADHHIPHSDPIDTAVAVRRLMASNHPAIRATEATERLAWKPPTAADVAMMWRTRSARKKWREKAIDVPEPTAADKLELMRQARSEWKKCETAVDVLYQALCDSELVAVIQLADGRLVQPPAWAWQEAAFGREMILGGKVRASAGEWFAPYEEREISIKAFQNWLDHCARSEPPKPTGNPAPDEASAIPVKAVAETERRAQAPDEAASSTAEEKGCPNAAIVERTGLKGLEALKASGLFDKWDKLAVDKLPVDTVDNSSVDRPGVDKTVSSVDKLEAVDKAGVDKRKAYQREWIREHRAKLRGVTVTSITRTAKRSRKKSEQPRTSFQTTRVRKVLRKRYPDKYPSEEEVSTPDLLKQFADDYDAMLHKSGELSPTQYGMPSNSTVLREVGRKVD